MHGSKILQHTMLSAQNVMKFIMGHVLKIVNAKPIIGITDHVHDV